MAVGGKKSQKHIDGNYDVPALRRQALASILWRVIVSNPDVIHWRKVYLGGKPLPQGKATAWWRSMAEDAPARRDAEWIAADLERRLQVDSFDILRAMIWDYRPEIVPVQFHPRGYDGALNLASPMPAAARICLSVAVSARTQEIVAAIKRIRKDHLRSKPEARDRLQSPKHLNLALFVAERGDAEALGKRGMEAWNRVHPQWAYRGEVKTFSRDARCAYRRLGAAGFRDALRGFGL